MTSIQILQNENEALKKELKNGKEKVDHFEAKYNELIAELKSLKDKSAGSSNNTKSNVEADETLSKVLAIATEASAGLSALQQEWSSLDTAVKGNTDRIDVFAQYSRINSLLIHGLMNIPDVDSYEFGIYIVNKINELLLPHLVFKIELGHLEFAHILSTKSKKKNVVIVKFKSRFAKNDVYDNRSKLKGTGVSITEHLTKKNLQLLKATRDIVGFINVWTSQTKILANLEGEVFHIKTSKDLEDLKTKCSSKFPKGLPEGYKAPRKVKEKRPKSRSFFRPPHYYPHPHAQLGHNQNTSAAWPPQQHPENRNSLNFASHDAYPPAMLSQSGHNY